LKSIPFFHKPTHCWNQHWTRKNHGKSSGPGVATPCYKEDLPGFRLPSSFKMMFHQVFQSLKAHENTSKTGFNEHHSERCVCFIILKQPIHEVVGSTEEIISKKRTQNVAMDGKMCERPWNLSIEDI